MFRGAVLATGFPVLQQFLSVWVLFLAVMVMMNIFHKPRKGRYRK